jgi:hypothetical protein
MGYISKWSEVAVEINIDPGTYTDVGVEISSDNDHVIYYEDINDRALFLPHKEGQKQKNYIECKAKSHTIQNYNFTNWFVWL